MIDWNNNIKFKIKSETEWKYFINLLINDFDFDKLKVINLKFAQHVYYDNFSYSSRRFYYNTPTDLSNMKYEIIDINKLLRKEKLKNILK